MTIKRKTIASTIAAVLAFSALGASAVSYDSVHYLNRYNTAGTSTSILPPHGNHFCALTRVGVRETDTSTEQARCTVRRSGTVWILEAYLGRSSDNDVFCAATCFNNW
jgi:hypothetical protein